MKGFSPDGEGELCSTIQVAVCISAAHPALLQLCVQIHRLERRSLSPGVLTLGTVKSTCLRQAFRTMVLPRCFQILHRFQEGSAQAVLW